MVIAGGPPPVFAGRWTAVPLIAPISANNAQRQPWRGSSCLDKGGAIEGRACPGLLGKNPCQVGGVAKIGDAALPNSNPQGQGGFACPRCPSPTWEARA